MLTLEAAPIEVFYPASTQVVDAFIGPPFSVVEVIYTYHERVERVYKGGHVSADPPLVVASGVVRRQPLH